MRRIIISAIVSAVIVATGAFVGVRRYGHASSYTVTAWDADVNGDGGVTAQDAQASFATFKAGDTIATGARPVAEQNLDASGHIKVAQQGPVDVNVLSSPASMVTAVLFNNEPFGAVEEKFSPFIAVGGCRHFSFFLATTGISSSGGTQAQWSADGIQWFQGPSFGGSAADSTTNPTLTFEGQAPYVRLRLDNHGSGAPVSAWLYCTP